MFVVSVIQFSLLLIHLLGTQVSQHPQGSSLAPGFSQFIHLTFLQSIGSLQKGSAKNEWLKNGKYQTNSVDKVEIL